MSADFVIGKAFLPANALSGSSIAGMEITLSPNFPCNGRDARRLYRGPLPAYPSTNGLESRFWPVEYLTYSQEVFELAQQKEGVPNCKNWIRG